MITFRVAQGNNINQMITVSGHFLVIFSIDM